LNECNITSLLTPLTSLIWKKAGLESGRGASKRRHPVLEKAVEKLKELEGERVRILHVSFLHIPVFHFSFFILFLFFFFAGQNSRYGKGIDEAQKKRAGKSVFVLSIWTYASTHSHTT
jgi:hypothetical protein